MYPLFWKQTLTTTKRQTVISALSTTPVSLLSRYFASCGQSSSKFIFCVQIFRNKQVINSANKSRNYCKDPARRIFITKAENLLGNFSTMSPKASKGKKAAKPPKADKEGKVEKKAKPAKKGAGDTPSRQSKRNVDKVAVSYKEVAENVDEKASEGTRPKAKAAVKAKKSKYTTDSGSEESGESSDEADSEDEKPKKKKRTAPTPRSAGERKETTVVAKKAKSEDAEPMNKTETDFDAIDFKSDKTTKDGKPWNLKISSWNIGGVKAWLKKGALDFIKHENPDIFCVQEVRCAESKMPAGTKVDGYHAYWSAAEKDGYSGVGLYSKVEPKSVTYGLSEPEHDTEGRLITAEYDSYYVVVAYVPNAGRGLATLPKRLKWDPVLRAYIKRLDDTKPVVLCGDLNVAHEAVDLANPKSNARSAGFTQEERDGFSELLKEGFVDSYRHLQPDKTGAYTYWTYMGNARSRNVGWRLDYFVLSEKLVPNLVDNVIRDSVLGSDHCPITLLLHV